MKSVEKDVIEQTSIQERNLEVFLKNFPGVVSTGEDGELVINTDKLKLALDPKTRFEENGYELNWVGKKEAYHQAYAKQAKLLNPLAADSKLNDGNDFLADSTQNLLIKGDNLEALKLLKASYFEQIKMIYIDPPYNTKSENFIYRDNFTDSEEQILDELGYSPEYKDYIENIQGARTHSGWLSFMFPRLLLARDLLKEDGVIFISIDDSEQANLKILCDEIFGEQNFEGHIHWRRRSNQPNDKTKMIGLVAESILVYSKDSMSLKLKKTFNTIPLTQERQSDFTNTDNDPKGPWSTNPWKAAKGRGGSRYKITTPNGVVHDEIWYGKESTFEKLKSEKKVHWTKNSDGVPRIKIYLDDAMKEGMSPNNFFNFRDFGSNQDGSKELQSLFGISGVFTNPKPTKLIKTFIRLATNSDDLVLDFFAGSGTTGQAVMDLNAEDGGNRKYILVQLPEAIDPKKQKDAYDFVTETLGKKDATIFEITAERLRRAGDKIKQDHADKDGIENLDIGFKAFEITDDPMQQFYKPLHEVTPEDLAQLEMAFSSETLEDALPKILINLLLAEKLPLSTPLVTLKENALYQAANVLLIVNDLPVEHIKSQLENASSRIEYVSIYSPNISGVQRDKFSQELKPALLQMGLDESRLRFRG